MHRAVIVIFVNKEVNVPCTSEDTTTLYWLPNNVTAGVPVAYIYRYPRYTVMTVDSPMQIEQHDIIEVM
jgi:hypothetical protein